MEIHAFLTVVHRLVRQGRADFTPRTLRTLEAQRLTGDDATAMVLGLQPGHCRATSTEAPPTLTFQEDALAVQLRMRGDAVEVNILPWLGA